MTIFSKKNQGAACVRGQRKLDFKARFSTITR
jgi:hypothetical protein